MAGAAEQRYPAVMVGQVVRKLETQHLQGGDPGSHGRRDQEMIQIMVFICLCERSTSAKPIPRVQTRSLLSTWPSPLITANQHRPTKSHARPLTCPLLTWRQTHHLDGESESPSTEETAPLTQNRWTLPQIPPLGLGTSLGRVQSCHARCGPPILGPGCLLHCGVRDREHMAVSYARNCIF